MNAPRAARFAETALAAMLWASLVAGSGVLALTLPWYTSVMTQALGVPQTAGLSSADTVQLAGSVRALVADRTYESLPATFAGQPAFDAAAVSHLIDVRRVIAAARLATGVVSLLLAAYAAWCIARRRFGRLSAGMRAGAALSGILMALALIAAVTDFSSFFTAFHGLFFASGTWTFPADSLLIRLFPERFWVTSGAAWAALVALGAAALLVVAKFVLGTQARLTASRTANNV